MEDYQLAGRSWISANVWELPERQVVTSDLYDPNRGRRDIRFYPTSASTPITQKPSTSGEAEELSLDLTEAERALNIREEEGSLLAKSPVPVEPMEVDQPVAPAPETAESPRRSPRIAAKGVSISY